MVPRYYGVLPFSTITYNVPTTVFHYGSKSIMFHSVPPNILSTLVFPQSSPVFLASNRMMFSVLFLSPPSTARGPQWSE